MSRLILVSGGLGGLGKTVAKKFLLNGDKVIISDMRLPEPKEEQDFKSLSSEINFFKVNVGDEIEVSDLADKIKDSLGEVQVLVNIAGGFAMSKIEDSTLSELDSMLDINLKTAFITSKTFIPHLKTSGKGRIINIAARAGLKGLPGISPYAISKAGVISLTESLAEELKDFDVTANAILPSTIDTPANRQAMPQADFSKWVTPEDIANVIFFLASEEARAVSGASIPVYHKA